MVHVRWAKFSLHVVVAPFCSGTYIAGGGGALGDGSSTSRTGLDIDGDERMQLARKLLLTTEWIVEAGQKHGQVWGDEGRGQVRVCSFLRHLRYPLWAFAWREGGRAVVYVCMKVYMYQVLY